MTVRVPSAAIAGLIICVVGIVAILFSRQIANYTYRAHRNARLTFFTFAGPSYYRFMFILVGMLWIIGGVLAVASALRRC